MYQPVRTRLPAKLARLGDSAETRVLCETRETSKDALSARCPATSERAAPERIRR